MQADWRIYVLNQAIGPRHAGRLAELCSESSHRPTTWNGPFSDASLSSSQKGRAALAPAGPSARIFPQLAVAFENVTLARAGVRIPRKRRGSRRPPAGLRAAAASVGTPFFSYLPLQEARLLNTHILFRRVWPHTKFPRRTCRSLVPSASILPLLTGSSRRELKAVGRGRHSNSYIGGLSSLTGKRDTR